MLSLDSLASAKGRGVGGDEHLDIWLGDINSLPVGADRLAELRLIVVPWAGPFVKPVTRELLARDDKDSSLLEHNNADQGPPRGAHLHGAPQRGPHGRDSN